jgi:hypothetical protein
LLKVNANLKKVASKETNMTNGSPTSTLTSRCTLPV